MADGITADPAPGAAGTGGAATANDSATKELADLQRQKIGASEKVYSGIERAAGSGVARMEHAYQQEGATLNDPALKPWNEKAEQAKFETDPIQAFGSLGSVFGILASAFTHAPMENALNASAAAINAVKQGNRQGYEDARQAWEKNIKLALDRHKLQHELYQDAHTLMSANLAAGEAKLRVLAARFDDKKVLTLLDNGMSAEVLQLQGAREQLAGKMADNAEKTITANAEMSMFLEKKDELIKAGKTDRQATMEAGKFVQEEQARIKRESSPYYNRSTAASTQREFIERRMQEIRETERREPTTDDQLKAQEEWTKATTRNRDLREREIDIKEKNVNERERHSRAMEDIQNRRGDNSEALAKERERHDKTMEEIQKTTRGGATNLTSARQRAADTSAIVADYKKENPDASAKEIAQFRADTERQLTLRSAAPSGNRLDDLRGKVDQVEQATDLTSKIEGLLAKHNAITGLGGKVTRPAEVVANIFGSNETDRKQFERWVHELQMIAPQILLGRGGRPLAAEWETVNSVVAGLKIGDTTANTVRAYRELDTVLKSIKDKLRERRGEEAAPAAAPNPDRFWDRDPVVH